MAAFEGSTRVPIVMAGPGVNHVGDGEVNTLVTLADLMPTMLDYAGVQMPQRFEDAPEDPESIDGYSLKPLLERGDAAKDSHRDFIISQFHGENAAMSWFMLRRADMKYVVWGTGAEHPPQLFNLTEDPGEWNNLALQSGPKCAPLIKELDGLLKTAIDYPEVARDVARYNLEMARWWTRTEPNWRGVLNGSKLASHSQPPGHDCAEHPTACELAEGQVADWGEIWSEHPSWYFDAWDRWINTPANATDSELIPKCPEGSGGGGALVHDWGAEPRV